MFAGSASRTGRGARAGASEGRVEAGPARPPRLANPAAPRGAAGGWVAKFPWPLNVPSCCRVAVISTRSRLVPSEGPTSFSPFSSAADPSAFISIPFIPANATSQRYATRIERRCANPAAVTDRTPSSHSSHNPFHLQIHLRSCPYLLRSFLPFQAALRNPSAASDHPFAAFDRILHFPSFLDSFPVDTP